MSAVVYIALVVCAYALGHMRGHRVGSISGEAEGYERGRKNTLTFLQGMAEGSKVGGAARAARELGEE